MVLVLETGLLLTLDPGVFIKILDYQEFVLKIFWVKATFLGLVNPVGKITTPVGRFTSRGKAAKLKTGGRRQQASGGAASGASVGEPRRRGGECSASPL